MATGVLDLLVNLAVEHRPRHGLIVGVERGFGFEFNRGPRGLDLVGSDPSKRLLGRAEATREHHQKHDEDSNVELRPHGRASVKTDSNLPCRCLFWRSDKSRQQGYAVTVLVPPHATPSKRPLGRPAALPCDTSDDRQCPS